MYAPPTLDNWTEPTKAQWARIKNIEKEFWQRQVYRPPRQVRKYYKRGSSWHNRHSTYGPFYEWWYPPEKVEWILKPHQRVNRWMRMPSGRKRPLGDLYMTAADEEEMARDFSRRTR